MRRAVADVRAHGDDRGPPGLGLGGRDGGVEGVEVVGVGHGLGVPVVGGEARHAVLGEGHLGGTVERDQVVVVEHDELAQPEVAGQRRRFRGDALHEVAVARDRVGVVVDDRRGRVVEACRRGSASATAMPTALPKPWPSGPGRGLDPRGVAVLGVPRRAAAELAEALEVVERQAVAGEVEHAVEQHAAVAGRQDEAVAVGPLGVRGVVLEVAGPQHVRHGGEAHRHAGVAGVGLLHGVDRQKADGVDAGLLEGLGPVSRLKAHGASLSRAVVASRGPPRPACSAAGSRDRRCWFFVFQCPGGPMSKLLRRCGAGAGSGERRLTARDDGC